VLLQGSVLASTLFKNILHKHILISQLLYNLPLYIHEGLPQDLDTLSVLYRILVA